MVNVGGKHSIFNVRQRAGASRATKCIIPAPYWVSYPDIVKYAGATPVYVQTKAGRRIQRKSRRHRKSNHAEDATADSEFAEQSDGRRDSAGRVRKDSRGLQENTTCG